LDYLNNVFTNILDWQVSLTIEAYRTETGRTLRFKKKKKKKKKKNCVCTLITN